MFDTRGILATPTKQTKQTAQRLKLQNNLLTTNTKRKKFGAKYTETTIFIHEDKYLSVSENPCLCFKPASRCLLFSKMNSRQENRLKLCYNITKVNRAL